MPTTRDDSPLLRSDVPDLGKDIRQLAASFGQSQEILSRIATRVDALGAPAAAPKIPQGAAPQHRPAHASASAASPAQRPPQAPAASGSVNRPERRQADLAALGNPKQPPKTPAQGTAQAKTPASQGKSQPPAARSQSPGKPAGAWQNSTGPRQGDRTAPSVPTAQSRPRQENVIPAFQSVQHPLPPVDKRVAAPKPEPWWTKEGAVTRVLGIVGGVLTAIGMAFFLAIVFNLVGPFGQLGIAVLVGALLGGSGWVLQQRHEVRRGLTSPRPHGHRFARPSTHIGALALLGTSIAVFMLIPVAASAVYELLPPAIGLVIVFVVAAGGLWLARKLNSAVMAGIGSCGAMVSMVIVGHSPLTLAAVAVMFLVSGLLTTHLGIVLRAVRTLTYLATVTAICALLWLNFEELLSGTGPTAYLAVLTATAVCAMFIGARDIEHDRSYELVTGACALVPTLPVAYYYFALPTNPNPFFFLLLSIFFIPAGIVLQLRASRLQNTTVMYGRVTMSLGAMALNGGLLWMARELDWPAGIACITLSVSAASAFAWLRHNWTLHSLVQACIIGAIPLLWTIPEILNPDLWMLPDEPSDVPGLPLVQLAVATAMLIFALYVLARTLPALLSTRPTTSTPNWAWALLSLAWIASTILYAGLSLTAGSGSDVFFYLGHLVVTVGCFALAIVLLSTKKALPGAKAVGAVVFLASLAKLFLVDLATMSALVRILVFCLVGGMLLVAATLLSNRAESSSAPASAGPSDPNGPRQHAQAGATQRTGAQGPSPQGASTHGPAAYGADPNGPHAHGSAAGRPGPQGPGR